MADSIAGAVSPWAPGTVLINRTARVGNIFFSVELGPVLVHEGFHVEQFAGMTGSQAAQHYAKYKAILEMTADIYEVNNYTCARAP